MFGGTLVAPFLFIFFLSKLDFFLSVSPIYLKGLHGGFSPSLGEIGWGWNSLFHTVFCVYLVQNKKKKNKACDSSLNWFFCIIILGILRQRLLFIY